MEPSRPDPDAVLANLKAQNPPQGFLKVFVGYAAGVGKSFAMLQAANAALLQGRDVTVGWIEPHARPDTLLLLAGMTSVPPRKAVSGTIELQDLDLDACLARRPEVLLVDELAHTNAPGSRHLKRWQDIEELLTAGIEVWTTLNIQHLDSMNDIVARVTGVKVQETVPDRIFDQAKEVEVVDVDPEDLIDRLQQGKIYRQEQARRALESFFKKENLLALRELTLRRAADRVGKEVDSVRAEKQISKIWPVRERLMVSVGPSPLSEDLLRQASRLARSLGAELLAVSIETPAHRFQDSQAALRLARNLEVAESLGAETVVLQGEEVARDLVAYARKRNVTKLVVGKNRDRGRLRFRRRTIGDELLRISGDIDVYVLSGRDAPASSPKALPRWKTRWSEWGLSALILAGFTGLAILFKSWGMAEANIVLTLLMSVVFSAALFGLSASVATSVLTVLAFNFFFTTPRYSLAVDDPQYYLVFLFLLAVGVVIGVLTQRLRMGVQISREREQRMETLNRMHRELASLVDTPTLRTTASALVTEILGGSVWIAQRDAQGVWTGVEDVSSPDLALFDWAWNHGQRAGRGTGTLSEHRLSVWPLHASGKTLGLLVLESPAAGTEWVESLAALVASALERIELIEADRVRTRQVETERTRNALLHSLSHDLRTPLTIINGSLETLESSRESKWSQGDRTMMAAIRKETWGLSRQVENLLELSRLTDGPAWTLESVPAEDPLCSAVDRFRSLHPECRVTMTLPEDLPLAPMEPRLIEQALANYLDNAWEYSGGLEIEAAVRAEGTVRYEIMDRGPGVPIENTKAIFQKFVRGTADKASGHRGTGLGLAIVHEVARIHHGAAGVVDRPGGGSVFFLEIPKEPS
jgi:two-component system sensor histidine kinase KdpD